MFFARIGSAAAVLACLVSTSALAQPQVGVSVQISQPGVYGRIDIGSLPVPQVVLPQPVIIQRPRVIVAQPAPPPEPVYLWVPPGHQRNWGRHCRRYNACGVPVYFVQDRWYREHVMRDHERGDDHGGDRGRGHGHGRGKHRD